jgi:hypothetical protein
MQKKISEIAASGKNVRGIAVKRLVHLHELQDTDIHNLAFLGILVSSYQVSPFPSADDSPVIVTGEHPLTARALVAQAGVTIAQEMISSGEHLRQMSDHEARSLVSRIRLWGHMDELDSRRLQRLLHEARQEVVVAVLTSDDVPLFFV